MGLLFGSKRRNIRAWEYALFEGKNDYLAMPNIALYEKLTAAQIENDCRIILESALTYVSSSFLLFSSPALLKSKSP